MTETRIKTDFDLIMIGGGAAGFFGAIVAAELKPGISILILEKTSKLLSKVIVSGGGRCNVTHNCLEPTPLSKHYPRGQKELKLLFRKFHAQDTVEWFAKRNVQLKTESDGRMFPVTDSSQTIVECFMKEVGRHQIKIEVSKEVTKLTKVKNEFHIEVANGESYRAKKILIATGGYNNLQSYKWIGQTSHPIIDPIPSLFTFNDSEKAFSDLMGVAVAHAEVKIAGTKLAKQGPVLITHWGLSGPAVITLSAWAADYLHSLHYNFTALINWTGNTSEEELRVMFADNNKNRGRQKVLSNPMLGIPHRLWQRLCELAQIETDKIWAELPQKNMNKLLEAMIRCPFKIKGKTTFKEEFVTCGGVDLNSIDLETMESKTLKGLYFAGEVLNIDGETGGFNFQSAWTTAYVAASNIVVNS